MVAPVVTELASHQCGQGSIPAEYHMWFEFVVASGLAPRVFPLVLRFFSLQKNQHFQIAVPSGQGTQLQFIRTRFIYIPLNISAISYETLRRNSDVGGLVSCYFVLGVLAESVKLCITVPCPPPYLWVLVNCWAS